MSVKDEKVQNLNEEVKVETNQPIEMPVAVEESKKTKLIKGVKKVGKYFGVALLGGVVGYLCGKGKSNKNDEEEYYDDSEIVETDVVSSDEE